MKLMQRVVYWLFVVLVVNVLAVVCGYLAIECIENQMVERTRGDRAAVEMAAQVDALAPVGKAVENPVNSAWSSVSNSLVID